MKLLIARRQSTYNCFEKGCPSKAYARMYVGGYYVWKQCKNVYSYIPFLLKYSIPQPYNNKLSLPINTYRHCRERFHAFVKHKVLSKQLYLTGEFPKLRKKVEIRNPTIINSKSYREWQLLICRIARVSGKNTGTIIE